MAEAEVKTMSIQCNSFPLIDTWEGNRLLSVGLQQESLVRLQRAYRVIPLQRKQSLVSPPKSEAEAKERLSFWEMFLESVLGGQEAQKACDVLRSAYRKVLEHEEHKPLL